MPTRRMPIGAEVQPGGGVHVRLWAPGRRRVEVVLEGGGAVPLAAEEGGYVAGLVADARAGSRYRFRLDDDPTLYPDPASRSQPEGPHGPSQVVDPGAYAWGDAAWRGVPPTGHVLYELHVGTFTPEGTWAAARRELPALAELGVTVIEMMPVAEFPGRFGWGYDGVDLFAPTRLYGTPDELRGFVDEAHRLGLGVIHDVVYNHLGPDGNYLRAFSDAYFTDRYQNEWGEAIDFDGPRSGPVRELFLSNAAYWIDEFHFDGLRLDATQSIFDASGAPLCREVGRRVREAARGRGTLVVVENEPQDARYVRPPGRDGFGLDMLWNDDFHHAAMVAVTGRAEAYFTDTPGSPQELLSAVKRGTLYQGQRYLWQGKRRGSPALDVPAHAFVTFLQNHDQVPNATGRGSRGHQLTSPGRWRAITALWLLGPGTPMLFQGQEFAASAPFFYFADHHAELARMVRDGRVAFVSQFPSIAALRATECLPEPDDLATFTRCKLDHGERARHGEAHALHRDLLRLRREEPVFARQQGWPHLDGAVLGPEALCVRYFADAPADDRLLIVNLGRDLTLVPAPEPLLAPPEGRTWEVQWSSDDPRYGGCGSAPPETDDGWRLPAHAALVLRGRP